MGSNIARHKSKGITGSFFERIFLEQKLDNVFGLLLIGAIACIFGYLIATQTVIGLGLFGFVIGFTVIVICIVSTELGLYINLVFAFISAFINRIFFHDEFPIGIIADLLVVITFLGLFVGQKDFKNNFRKMTNTTIMIAILLYTGYLMIELFNPHAKSFDGWFQTVRRFIVCIFMIYIAYTVFNSMAAIRRFLKMLFIVGVFVGLYGCYQQWFGLLPVEIEVALNGKEMHEIINMHGGNLRKFSTLTDPMAYGIIMAALVVFYLIIAINEKKSKNRAILLLGCLVMFLGMMYSGTRTANVMVVAGIGMYCLMTMDRKSTKIFMVASVFIFIALLKVPIYNNAPLNRFRTSFLGSDDPSFNVREINRKNIQPYIYSHPIGGGLCTTGETGIRYNPGHELAGFPPDSSYLRKALETGWIGLIFIMAIYFITMKYVIRAFFDSNNKRAKNLFAASIGTLFAFYISEFPQEALGQLTDMVVYYPLLALVIRLRQRESDRTSNALATVS